MCFLLVNSYMYVNFYQIWTKNKKVSVANFCAYGHLKIVSGGNIRTYETKKIQLVLCFYLLPFPRNGALKI